MSISFNWVNVVASMVVGFLLGIFTEPFRLWLFRPRISLSFTADEHCIRKTPVKATAGERVFRSSGVSVRFFVENKKRFYAKSCRCFLTRIECKDSTGLYTALFLDRIPLKWSYLECQAMGLPGKMGFYCDLVGSFEPDPRLIPGCCEPRPQIFDDLFREKAVYRFTATVSAQDADPTTIRINVKWEGHWRILDAWSEDV